MHTRPYRHIAAALAMLALLFMLQGCRRAARYGQETHSVEGFAGYDIVGIDISAHNGDIDFEKVRDAGVKFVYIKATEGGTFKDRRFIENLRQAREAGLKVGAYHFFRFDTPGYIQGLNFAASIKGRKLDLPAVIDIEEFSNPNFQATRLVLERLTEMADYLEEHGYRIMFYTNKKGYARFIRGRFESYPLWLCSLGSLPDSPECDIWQATHHGRVSGIDSDVDINVYPHPASTWEAFASGIR